MRLPVASWEPCNEDQHITPDSVKRGIGVVIANGSRVGGHICAKECQEVGVVVEQCGPQEGAMIPKWWDAEVACPDF